MSELKENLSIYVGSTFKPTEAQQIFIKERLQSMLLPRLEKNTLTFYSTGLKHIQQAIDEFKSQPDVRIRLEKPDWEKRKKDPKFKPMLDALNRCLRRSNLFIFFEDKTLEEESWEKKLLLSQGVDSEVKVIVVTLPTGDVEDVI